jgi:lysophospholipase L1-like esterase
MTWTRIGPVVFAIGVLAAFFWWPRPQQIVDSHRTVRQFMVHLTLSRFDDPVIVLGDSNVEAASLPQSLCNHAVVNAGFNGASTASDLGTWLAEALAGRRAAMIVVALGINDALTSAPPSKERFAESYGALLARLSSLTPQMVVLGIPQVEIRGKMTAALQSEAARTIDAYNSILPEIASKNAATFAALPAMPEPHTIDGVHLNAAGYLVWDKAVLQGAAAACKSN